MEDFQTKTGMKSDKKCNVLEFLEETERKYPDRTAVDWYVLSFVERTERSIAENGNAVLRNMRSGGAGRYIGRKECKDTRGYVRCGLCRMFLCDG